MKEKKTVVIENPKKDISSTARRKAVAYIRYSDKKQEGNHSEEIQKKHIQALADRLGVDIVSWRIDKAKSGFRNNVEKRKGIQELISDVENGIDVIIFYDESRTTRSITDFVNRVYKRIKKLNPNATFYSTKDGNVEWDPEDTMVKARMIFDAQESESKSSRAKDYQITILKSDKVTRPGGREPVGYSLINGKLTPDNDADVIELIYFLASWGHSCEAIANFLNAATIKTKKIKHWKKNTIHYILNNPAYHGHLKWDMNIEGIKDFFENNHVQAVNPMLLYLTEQTQTFKKQYGTLYTPYYFRDILKCSQCKKNVAAKDDSPKGKSKEYLNYKCAECKGKISIHLLHDELLAQIQSNLNIMLQKLIKVSHIQLHKWKNKLEKNKSHILTLKEKAMNNQLMLANEITNNTSLASAFADGIHFIQEELTLVDQTLEDIERLNSSEYLNLLFSNLFKSNLHNFSDCEMRVFILMFVKEVHIDFEQGNAIEIEYRQNPFTSLENTTERITETVQKFKKLNER